MSYDPETIESDVANYWEQNNVIERVRELTDGNESFFMIDGPPYLNGPPHVGHMQGKVLKDVMLRFKQMQGYDVWDQAGFDTHGLPNELATEEKLGIENKNEIGDSISPAKFITECKDRATSAQDLWKGVMGELAIWQDFDNPYLTFDKDYIESEWWLVKQAHEQGLLYQAGKPIHWCPRCQTSLSGYEVTDEYQEVTDLSIFVPMPLENRDEHLLIWTTTPWTIPANMAIYVHPDFEYARVEVDDRILIIAEQLVDTVMDKAGYDEDEYDILNTLKGIQLQGKKYEHPLLDRLPKQQDLDEEQGIHRVHTSDELVTLEEGTGLVHAATGHGIEDYEETRKIDLPVFSPVDEEGKYTEAVGDYEGAYVHDVNERVTDDLADAGYLFHKEAFEHEYPHCWRCKTKLVYRAADQWFIRNDEVKQQMLDENDDVNWVPDHVQKRFSNFVESSPDWCISRQNYWGTPIPIWVCNDCGDEAVLGSFADLEEQVGELPEDFDPHKHTVDDMTWSCDCGGTYERIPDILDVWFDSGCAPFASVHYPFDEQPLEQMWPMDFITEASDQIRGWFYSLLFCGILGFDEAPYDTVLFQGHVLDEEGQKMSKSVGNVIDPQEQIEKYGADLPRFYSLRVASPWEQTKYDEDEIEQEVYRLFSVFWNTKEFLETHGEQVEKPSDDAFKPEDTWLRSRLASLIDEAHETMETQHFHETARAIESFVLDDLSRWYLKGVRSRIKKGDPAATWTLQEAIMTTAKLLAPFAPYVTEKIYQDLDGDVFSVHASSYPEAREGEIDASLEEAMTLTREIVDQAIKLRDENEYNLRWPARRLVIATDEAVQDDLDSLSELIASMANVDTVEFGEVSTKLVAEPHYPSLGPKFGSDAEHVADLIEELDHEQVEQLQSVGEIVIDDYDLEQDDVDIKNTTVSSMGNKEFAKGQLYLDLHMTDEIKERAFVNEIVRSIQQHRKEAGLEMDDEVVLTIDGDTAPVKNNESIITDRVNLDTIRYEEPAYENEETVSFEGFNATYSFSEPVA